MIDTIVLIIISVLSLAFGSFIFLKPMKAFAIQKKFYELINWRIEPISVKKEIRNTKAMGLFLILAVITVWIYRLINL